MNRENLNCRRTALTRRRIVAKQAEGTFAVNVAPVEASHIGHQGDLDRMTLDKTFAGALTGDSKGEMLIANTQATGSMAYVALERVTGTLDGRAGSFVLMHNGAMMKSDPNAGELHVRVVPGSGTGDLTGLSGTMKIVNESGQHSYVFEYELTRQAATSRHGD
jgi:hypothetical protein